MAFTWGGEAKPVRTTRTDGLLMMLAVWLAMAWRGL